MIGYKSIHDQAHVLKRNEMHAPAVSEDFVEPLYSSIFARGLLRLLYACSSIVETVLYTLGAPLVARGTAMWPTVRTRHAYS